MQMLVLLVLEAVALTFGATETIHFTNSPRHIFKQNFTTYKLNVPNSEPITIFEATKNDEIGSDNRNESSVPLNTITRRNGELYYDKTLLSKSPETLENHNDPIAQDGLKRDNGGSKKIVYSPDLLKKFLVEYADKLKNADDVTKDEIENIVKQTENTEKHAPLASDEEISSDVEQKYNPSSYADRNRLPYDQKDGWVTLDAVPWSTSKVSKWHANANSNSPHSTDPYSGIRPIYNQNQRPSYFSGSGISSYGPNPLQSAWNDFNNDDKYIEPIKNRPPFYGVIDDDDNNSYDFQRPSGWPSSGSTSSSSYNFNSNNNNHNQKPIVTPWTNYGYKQPDNSRPSYQTFRPTQTFSVTTGGNKDHFYHNYGNNDDNNNNNQYHNQRPYWNQDIITDNSKPNYPQKYSYNQNTDRYDDQQNSHKFHPSTHPANGNGEWVLVSHTKGYQYPRQNGQRAISYQPNNTVHKSVKLTVLPALDKEVIRDGHRRPMSTTTVSHGGMLEVDSSYTTVEEDHHNNVVNQPAQQPHGPIKRKFIKAYPLATKQPMQDSSAVIAAVGAGMVPATMAMLMPIVLGRKKRAANQIKRFV